MTDTEIVAPGNASEPRDDVSVSYAELQRHTNQSSLWVLIGGIVYDVTSLLSLHPGGTGPLFKYAGKDATCAHPI
jgi:L-lactate dehydrogenase (cytochrome)